MGYGGIDSYYKSGGKIHFIPRGEIYSGSGYTLSNEPGYQATGLELFEGNGLYVFDFNAKSTIEEPYFLITFTGRKLFLDPNAYNSTGNAAGFPRFYGYKHYKENPLP